MRITSGIYRGRTLVTPDTTLTHPMGDRERLALFNRIGPYLPHRRVLDLYCGSGALGIESLSRGALSAVFVDSSPKAVAATRQNLANLQISAEVIRCDVGKSRRVLSKQLFDVILCDPPYDRFNPEEFKDVATWLTDGGIFVLSHPDTPPELAGLTLSDTRSYARANLSLYHKH